LAASTFDRFGLAFESGADGGSGAGRGSAMRPTSPGSGSGSEGLSSDGATPAIATAAAAAASSLPALSQRIFIPLTARLRALGRLLSPARARAPWRYSRSPPSREDGF